MALQTKQFISQMYEKNRSYMTFTMTDICNYTQLPHRSIDAWIKDGMLSPVGIAVGQSGHNKTFDYDRTFMILLLGELQNLGIGIHLLRECVEAIAPMMNEPFGYISLDLKDLSKSAHYQEGFQEISAGLREHFRYGSSSPSMIYDLDKLHLQMDDMYHDADLKNEIALIAEIMGKPATFDDLPRLVYVITDMDEFKKKGRPSGKSRFRK
jgi:hypothetical protein